MVNPINNPKPAGKQSSECFGCYHGHNRSHKIKFNWLSNYSVIYRVSDNDGDNDGSALALDQGQFYYYTGPEYVE